MSIDRTDGGMGPPGLTRTNNREEQAMQAVTECVKEGTAVDGACAAAVKWAAVVDDVVVPMPQRRVKVRVVRAQAGVGDEFVLVRDHNSPDDVLLGNDEEIDLADGNVFYRLRACEVQPRGHCTAPAKLAFVVDDRQETTLRCEQTGQSLRDLFTIPAHAHLIRDTEGPRDENIDVGDAVHFADGPVFYTRAVEHGLRITVNARPFTEANGVKPEMSRVAIAALVYPDNPDDTTVTFVSDGNRPLGAEEVVKIHGCEVFDVVRKNVSGGYEETRVTRELAELQGEGMNVVVITDPTPAVIYPGLRSGFSDGAGAVLMTDVLVPIPAGYPGQLIDWAYLPADSPLIGRVKGSPQDQFITAAGRQWRQISYHPHNGGGGPKWDPTVHGFHTYLAEVLSWLRSA
jgi:hypothetical protein